MHDDDLPFDLSDLNHLLFGEDAEERNTYEAKWVDHFWDTWFTGAIVSATLDDAVDIAVNEGPEGAELESVRGPDGHSYGMSGHTVREAQVLVDTANGLVEEIIPSLTFEMTVDLAELLFRDSGTVLGVQEGDRVQWLFHPDDGFHDRPDLPVGWAWARPGGAR